MNIGNKTIHKRDSYEISDIFILKDKNLKLLNCEK